MKIKITRLILSIIFLFGMNAIVAQIQWHAKVGGGTNFLYNLSRPYAYKRHPGILLKAGTSISSSFGKDAITGWEIGIKLVNDGYYWIPELFDDNKRPIGWDQDNKLSIRDWYVQLPVSLTFNFFEKAGFLLGGSISRRVSHLNDVNYVNYRREWLPSGHLGIFGQITPRMRLDVKAYLDLEPWQLKPDRPGMYYDKSRKMGGSLNFRYTIL